MPTRKFRHLIKINNSHIRDSHPLNKIDRYQLILIRITVSWIQSKRKFWNSSKCLREGRKLFRLSRKISLLLQQQLNPKLTNKSLIVWFNYQNLKILSCNQIVSNKRVNLIRRANWIIMTISHWISYLWIWLRTIGKLLETIWL